jgi:hypothetical protein
MMQNRTANRRQTGMARQARQTSAASRGGDKRARQTGTTNGRGKPEQQTGAAKPNGKPTRQLGYKPVIQTEIQASMA